MTAVGVAAVVKYSSSGKPLGEEWHMVEDGSGGVYYYNEVTGESQWDTPRPPDGAPPTVVSAAEENGQS